MTSFSSGSNLTIATFDKALSNTSTACDLSALRFIDAYGLVGTACAILSSRPLDLKLPDRTGPHHHLDSMGLTRVLHDAGYSSLGDPAPLDRPDVLVPLTQFKSIHAAEALSHLLVEQLGDSASAQVIEPLTEGLWELAANAVEHSGEQALLMGQVYRKGEPPHHNANVQVVVGDVGKGILRSFQDSQTQQPADDLAAIRLALEYLVSSVPDRGRGQGLTTTAEGVTPWGGELVVRSGTSRVTVTRDGQQAASVPYLAGTLVGISLPLYP
jgi:hypothetical protein